MIGVASGAFEPLKPTTLSKMQRIKLKIAEKTDWGFPKSAQRLCSQFFKKVARALSELLNTQISACSSSVLTLEDEYV